MSGVSVKVYLPSTCKDYSEMCPTKGPTRLKNRTVEELEEDADCNCNVCK